MQTPPGRLESVSDAELIRRAGTGDETAFAELHRRFVRPVLGFAIRRLGDRGRAEDATQETFAAIWRSAWRYRPERGAARSWLFTIAHNAIVDQTRVRREPAVDVPDATADEPGPVELAEADWLGWRVHRALEELPDRERTLIELAYWSELSQSEIAERLAIPLGTVKTRTRSALARLAELLERDELR
jgi:RNA polymerase sigma-70 factor (ECF subfamily)